MTGHDIDLEMRAALHLNAALARLERPADEPLPGQLDLLDEPETTDGGTPPGGK